MLVDEQDFVGSLRARPRESQEVDAAGQMPDVVLPGFNRGHDATGRVQQDRRLAAGKPERRTCYGRGYPCRLKPSRWLFTYAGYAPEDRHLALPGQGRTAPNSVDTQLSEFSQLLLVLGRAQVAQS